MSRERSRWVGTKEAYQKRWDVLSKARSEMQAELLEAEVLWGNDIKKLFDPLFDVENDLYFHTITMLDSLDPDFAIDERTAVDFTR